MVLCRAINAFGGGFFCYLNLQMGVGPLMHFAQSGQIIIATIASHFGWFELPVKPITFKKVLGVISLTVGVSLLNWEQSYAH